MLRTIRLTIAIVSFTLISMLFLDFTGTIHTWFGWLAKIQLLPALLAWNVGVVAFLIILTLVFGRIYCSVTCPLGIFQDIISWLAGKQKKNRFHYSPALSWLRYGILSVFIMALFASVGSLVALLDPYSAYGRIVSNLFTPLWLWGNNLLAYGAERINSYTFYSVEVWMKSAMTLGIAITTFVVLTLLARQNGRSYCNTICPIGTLLGFFSRYSIYKPVIDTSNCNHCNLCARNCKASCINSEKHEIDYSRCVTCMDCIGTCKRNAIKYTRPDTLKTENGEQRINKTRRNFLAVTALFATTTALKAQEKKVDGGLAVIEDKKIPERITSLTPPGSLSIRNFNKHCTACQLCVSVCPNHVLRPSHTLSTFMQPEMSYERGYCRPECVKCSEVCPTGAIHPITPADKSAIQIGHAVWVKENCIPLTDGVSCGNCARHCPTEAIHMVTSDPNVSTSPRIPVVNTEHCIGCGACENLCPARPFSAIYVEGHQSHRIV
ncbi:4Fe-4S binding protein [Gabonibacter chumensis]|uniref:4Fe-4S binding protein n=1 Tax=Gabonibacter chumensis TaxID=2972474 RepID=UPI0025737D25|nr:4Fe-4S binding protein [Gabonibacter chumensis]MCR9011866.1 4Fe-4S binding protein [Gabonibacter chumensis]